MGRRLLVLALCATGCGPAAEVVDRSPAPGSAPQLTPGIVRLNGRRSPPLAPPEPKPRTAPEPQHHAEFEWRPGKPWAGNPDGLTRRWFELEKDAFLLGEPILVTYRAERPRGEDVEVVGGDYRRHQRSDNYGFTAVHEDGKPVPDPFARRVALIGGGMMGFPRITAEEPFKAVLVLQHFLDLRRPGAYVLTCTKSAANAETVLRFTIREGSPAEQAAMAARWIEFLRPAEDAAPETLRLAGLAWEGICFSQTAEFLPFLAEVLSGGNEGRSMAFGGGAAMRVGRGMTGWVVQGLLVRGSEEAVALVRSRAGGLRHRHVEYLPVACYRSIIPEFIEAFAHEQPGEYQPPSMTLRYLTGRRFDTVEEWRAWWDKAQDGHPVWERFGSKWVVPDEDAAKKR